MVVSLAAAKADSTDLKSKHARHVDTAEGISMYVDSI